MPMNKVTKETAKNDNRKKIDFFFADAITLNAIPATTSNKIVSNMVLPPS